MAADADKLNIDSIIQRLLEGELLAKNVVVNCSGVFFSHLIGTTRSRFLS